MRICVACGASLAAGADQEGDLALAQDLLGLMAEARADFTLTFRKLAMRRPDLRIYGELRALLGGATALDALLRGRRTRLASGGRSPAEAAGAMQLANSTIFNDSQSFPAPPRDMAATRNRPSSTASRPAAIKWALNNGGYT